MQRVRATAAVAMPRILPVGRAAPVSCAQCMSPFRLSLIAEFHRTPPSPPFAVSRRELRQLRDLPAEPAPPDRDGELTRSARSDQGRSGAATVIDCEPDDESMVF